MPSRVVRVPTLIVTYTAEPIIEPPAKAYFYSGPNEEGNPGPEQRTIELGTPALNEQWSIETLNLFFSESAMELEKEEGEPEEEIELRLKLSMSGYDLYTQIEPIKIPQTLPKSYNWRGPLSVNLNLASTLIIPPGQNFELGAEAALGIAPKMRAGKRKITIEYGGHAARQLGGVLTFTYTKTRLAPAPRSLFPPAR